MEERRCSGGREGVAAVVVVARFQISRRLDAGRSWTHYSVESLRRSIVKDLEDEVSEGEEKKGKKKKCALHEDKVGGRETFVIALVFGKRKGGNNGKRSSWRRITTVNR